MISTYPTNCITLFTAYYESYLHISIGVIAIRTSREYWCPYPPGRIIFMYPASQCKGGMVDSSLWWLSNYTSYEIGACAAPIRTEFQILTPAILYRSLSTPQLLCNIYLQWLPQSTEYVCRAITSLSKSLQSPISKHNPPQRTSGYGLSSSPVLPLRPISMANTMARLSSLRNSLMRLQIS